MFNNQRPTVEELWWNDRGIKVSVIDDDIFYRVTVPFEEIADVTPFKIREQSESRNFGFFLDDESLDAPPERGLPYTESSSQLLELDLLGKARRRGFPIESNSFHIAHLRATSPPTYGPPEFGSDTFLYCDWDFFQHQAGGLTGLGFGVPFGSASASWQRSLWADVEKRTKGHVVDVAEVCKKKDNAVLRGFPIFLDFENLPSSERRKYKVEMEGQSWWPLAVSRESTGGEAPSGPWAYVLAKEAPSDSWPRELWERIPTAIRFFGEVIHWPVETQFGHAQCVLKVRAIAHLATDQTR